MFKNYVKIAWRNLIKSRLYSAINIVGLSVGIAFTLFIAAYIWSELQVNKHLKNAENQYIILSEWKNPDQGYKVATLGPLAKTLKEQYPDLVANYYRFDGITSTISFGDKSFRETIAIGDSSLLNMYGFKLMHGNAATALNAPFTVVITADKALKYFGKTDVAGQTITIENFSGSKHDFLITGVMEIPSRNTITNFSGVLDNPLYISTENLDFFNREMNWDNIGIVEFVELQKGINPAALNIPMAHLIRQNGSPDAAKDLAPYLVPLKEYYLTANNGFIKKLIYALSAVALFILAMAIINYINLSVSRAGSRIREIGIRKVLGGLKRQLIVQFLTESVMLVFAATVFAFIIFQLTRGLFSGILNKEIPRLDQFPSSFLIFPLLLVVLIGLIGGIYPAFILSSLPSVASMKGRLSSSGEKGWLRKGLVGFQFVTAMIAFTAAIVISNQINLFIGRDLGYNKDYILSAQVPRNWTAEGVNKMMAIRDQFKALPVVENVSLAYEIPNGNNAGQTYISRRGTNQSTAMSMQLLQTDENYLSVYRIPLLAGSYFDGNRQESGKVVLNETALHALGWQRASDAIGKPVIIAGEPEMYTVMGVTKDFHFGSMEEKIAPVLFFNVRFSNTYRFLVFKVKPGNISASIEELQKSWRLLMPGAPFEYKFMDETLSAMYQSEIQLKKASYTATVLTLIIVLLGVAGLVSLSIQKRVKEVGIRKVLGSSAAAIVALFLKEFLWIMLIGAVVACPLSYLIMNGWLQEYAYRIDLNAQPFLISILGLGLVTAVLVCLQTLNAAFTIPVKSLKAE